MLPRQFRYEKRRNRRRIAERPVVVPDETIDELDGRRPHPELGVLGVKRVGERAGRPRLVERRRIVEPDRERLDGRGRRPAHDAHDDRRIDATAQKRAQRNVAHEPARHGGGDQLSHLIPRGPPIDVERIAGAGESKLPVRLDSCARPIR
jgi:hypothetical protein